MGETNVSTCSSNESERLNSARARSAEDKFPQASSADAAPSTILDVPQKKKKIDNYIFLPLK